MDCLLRAEHLTICYEDIPVVQDVSFELKEGEILGIVGESGSGKSTIVRAIMGLLGNEGMITEGRDLVQRKKSCFHVGKAASPIPWLRDRNGVSGLRRFLLSCSHHRESDL